MLESYTGNLWNVVKRFEFLLNNWMSQIVIRSQLEIGKFWTCDTTTG